MQYITFPYKGAEFKISAFYDNVTDLVKIDIPANARLKPHEIIDITRSFQTMTRARTAPIDRNPLDVVRSYTNVAAAVLTERWSYTVPANRKATAELMQLMINYGTQVTGTQDRLYITCTPKDGVAAIIFDLAVSGEYDSITTTYYAPAVSQFATNLTFYEGDTLKGYTVFNHASTGLVSAKLTEFDA